MAVTADWYLQGRMHVMRGDVAPETDTLKVALLGSGYTPDRAAHEFFADLTDEITGTGYTAGGVELTGVSVTTNDLTMQVRVLADDAQWPGATFDADQAVIYQDTGSDATSLLLAVVSFGETKSPVGVTFPIQWAGGVMLRSTTG